MLLKMAQTKPKAEEETVFPCTLTLCRPRILAGKSRSGKIGTWEHELTVSQSPESLQLKAWSERKAFPLRRWSGPAGCEATLGKGFLQKFGPELQELPCLTMSTEPGLVLPSPPLIILCPPVK